MVVSFFHFNRDTRSVNLTPSLLLLAQSTYSPVFFFFFFAGRMHAFHFYSCVIQVLSLPSIGLI